MFLICNALLVFLTKYSGLARSLSLSSHQDELRSKNFTESSQSESSMQLKKLELISVPESIGLVENFSIEEGNEEECYLTNQRETENEVVEDKEQEEKGQREEKQQEQEENACEKVAENEDENDWTKDGFLIEQKEEEEEDDDDNEEVGNGVLSTEELNKKFDEFIRRMKEELRIEAQRQLIMV
ncbi:hypothetical protein TIFTF001_045863 [Ficus carica]|uniref:Uncharacterized protein n=1 Tax=Ficus carica TaxID=3494 RepID=A0AA87ZDU7_FICCA|nr:hypothetical protein TIFTF001_045863 [Ficus carica]